MTDLERMREAVAKAKFLTPGTPECEKAMQAALDKIQSRTAQEQQNAMEAWRKWSGEMPNIALKNPVPT